MLRVQDIDFGNHLVMVRSGKGGKDRTTLLPPCLIDELHHHLSKVKGLFENDLINDQANVWLPEALAKKHPKAPMSWHTHVLEQNIKAVTSPLESLNLNR